MKNPPAMQEMWVLSLDREDILEQEMATHSSTLAWEIAWTEEPGRLQSMGLQRVRHDLSSKQQHYIKLRMLSCINGQYFIRQYNQMFGLIFSTE